MLRSLFLKSLRDHRGAILGYGLGAGFYVGAMLLFYPYIQGVPGLSELMDRYPPALRALFGQDAWKEFATVPGFLVLDFFGLAPLVLSVFTCNACAGLIAGEEERQTLDLLLSNPLPRWRVVLEKYAAVAVALLAICLLTAVGALLGASAIDVRVSLAGLVRQCLLLFPICLGFGTVGLFLSSFLRRRPAGGLALGFVFASYLWNSFAPLVERLKDWQGVSLFFFYRPLDAYERAPAVRDVATLLAVTALLLVASLPLFQRKDLGV